MSTEATPATYLTKAILSFPNLVEPQKSLNAKTGKERISYNVDLIVPPDHPGLAQFMQRVGALALAEWKEHANNVLQMAQADRRLRCYGAGSEKINSKTFQVYDGYAGMYYISASNRNPPQIFQADGTLADPTNTMLYQALARKLYGGCLVNAALNPWLQQNEHGRGVRCDLVAIQFAGDGKPFGAGAVNVTGMFGAVATAPTQAAPAVAMPGLPFPGMGAPVAPQTAQQPAVAPLPPFLMMGR